jgi:outer membrane protein OmpA-like peptidoglycan-associated protein
MTRHFLKSSTALVLSASLGISPALAQGNSNANPSGNPFPCIASDGTRVSNDEQFTESLLDALSAETFAAETVATDEMCGEDAFAQTIADAPPELGAALAAAEPDRLAQVLALPDGSVFDLSQAAGEVSADAPQATGLDEDQSGEAAASADVADGSADASEELPQIDEEGADSAPMEAADAQATDGVEMLEEDAEVAEEAAPAPEASESTAAEDTAPAEDAAEDAPVTDEAVVADDAPAEEAAPVDEVTSEQEVTEDATAESAESEVAEEAQTPEEGETPDAQTLAADLAAQEADEDGAAEAEAEATEPVEAETETEVEAQAEADTGTDTPVEDETEQAEAEATAEADASTEAPETEQQEAAPAAAAASSDEETDDAAPEVVTEDVTDEDVRTSDQDFETSAAGLDTDADTSEVLSDSGTETTAESGTRQGMSNFERALLLGLGAAVVGNVLSNGDEVVSNSGDRVVVRRGDELRVLKNDSELLRQAGSQVATQTYGDGSTRTTITYADGSQIVTVQAADGTVLRRVRVQPDGTRVVLFDDTTGFEPVNVTTLPQVQAASDVQVSQAGDEALRAALQAALTQDAGRTFSLSQVRQIKEVRDLAPQVELDTITFATGSAAIQPSQAEQLISLGSAIKDVISVDPSTVILVEGHTDTVGDAGYNLALSDRRAETVALALTEYFEVPAANLITQGYGESNLKIAQEGDIRENRRAAIRNITDLLR